MSAKRREKQRPSGANRVAQPPQPGQAGQTRVRQSQSQSPNRGSRVQARQPRVEARVLGLPRRVAAGVAAVVVVGLMAIGAIALLGGGDSGAPSPSVSPSLPIAAGSGATPAASSQWTVKGTNGTWTNVNPDRLAAMLASKDFTLVNVKTPYFAEIEKTDLFIPYDQIVSQASKLPQDKSARILVYCRSGVESRQAAEMLVSLGYTNVWNLDGGMLAWQSSGRQLLYTHKP